MITPSPTNTAALLGLDINGIMWTDGTCNPGLFGCAYASPACGTADRSSQCYAEAMAARIVRMGGPAAARYAEGLTPEGRWTGRVSVHPELIAAAFAKFPKKPGRIRRVFVTSMSDLFHADVPFDFLDAVFAQMSARPWISFQVLTKRADRMAEYAEWRRADCARSGSITSTYQHAWPPNVWAGVTVEDQRRANERIPYLLSVPAAVRFLSVEPMLGKIDLRNMDVEKHEAADRITAGDYNIGAYQIDALTGENTDMARPCPDVRKIGWLIIGSESDGNNPGKRETDPAWVTDLIGQCDRAKVPVFLKQLSINGRLCMLPMLDGKVRADFPKTTT